MTERPPAPAAVPSSDERADWVSRLADEVIAEADRRGTPVVCASGLSPSGPIHLGNLREVMAPHLVADEIRRRGIACEHLISWDDYDRFRRVPASVPGVDESWAEHIGRPLTAVPAPPGSPHASWAAHFRAQAEESFAALGIRYRGISQTEQYTGGAYTDQILFAMSHREQIDKVLDQFRTLPDAEQQQSTSDTEATDQDTDPDQQAAALAAEGSGAAQEDDGGGGGQYYPYRPYCTACGRDTTTVTAYEDETTSMSYVCACGHGETVLLRTFRSGKLVWKVDWPMRWAYEKVVFEPSGVDHQSPGSSFEVGKLLCPLFGWERPYGPMYAFVGIAGMAKMSSSRGRVPVPAEALQIMEPALLRWLYARRRMNQSFDVSFGSDLQRLYDEWDALGRKISAGTAQAAESAAQLRAATTADGPLPSTPHPVAYRTLASVVDITTGDEDQVLRIVGQIDPQVNSLELLRPRLTCVEHWVRTQMPEQDKTVVRSEPATDGVSADDRAALSLLLDGNGVDGPEGLPAIEQAWTIDGLTHQVYGVPKVLAGLPADQIVKGDKEIAAAQRGFFTLLYRLLVDADTGPRLPTLLLAIGPDRVRALLGG